MRTLCNVFVDLKVDTVQAVKDMVRNGFYRLNNQEEQLSKLTELGDRLAEIYEIPAPSGTEMFRHPYACGRYDTETNKIYVNKASVVTYLHEFRHHMHNVKEGLAIIGSGEPGDELDAQAWACSVFKKACPRMFAKAVVNNRIAGMKYQNGKLMNNDNSSEGIYPPEDIQEELEQIVEQRSAGLREMLAAASVEQIAQETAPVRDMEMLAVDADEPYDSGEE